MDSISEPTQPFASSSSSSTPFDPNAVTPAFARSTSTTSTLHSSAPASSSRLSIPALGESTLMGELPTTDPLSILLQKHLPPHIRPVRDLSGAWHGSAELPDPFSSTDHHPQQTQEGVTEETVRQAAATNSWRKIATLARSHIESYTNREKQRLYNQQRQLIDTPLAEEGEGVEEVLEWWSVRLYALARLRLYSMLQTELATVWQIVSTTPITEGGVMISDTAMIPFSVRVLRATEPKFRGDIRTTVEQYTLLVQLCKAQIKRLKAEKNPEGVRVWRERAVNVGLMLGYTLAEAKDYKGAIEVLGPLVESMLKDEKEDVEKRVHLVVIASRVWVQAGLFPTALSLLTRSSLLLSPSSPLHTQIAHSRALISAISASSPSPPFSKKGEVVERLNAAIVEFYAAKLDVAIASLEAVLQENSALVAGVDAVVFNTATLYELGVGGEREVVEKKRDLLANVGKWAGEPGPSGSSFKL